MGMMLVPIFVGMIFRNQASSIGTPDAISEQAAAVQAEYIFLGLGILAILISLVFARISASHPELELDKPADK